MFWARAWLLVGVGWLAACDPQRLDVVEGPAHGSGGADAAGGSAGSFSQAGEAGTAGVAAGGVRHVFPDSLVHRYDFEGSGTTVVDRVSGADGTLVGVELALSEGRGAAILAGGKSGEYVELPPGIISGLPNATFEAWVTWNGQTVWERVFDFGTSYLADNGAWEGETYLFITPRTPIGIGGVLRAAQLRGRGEQELVVNAGQALPVNQRAHVVLVVDDEQDVVQLFLNGEFVTSRGIVTRSGQSFDALATVNDQNVWLGRSQYEQDAFFGGVFHEFRIYRAALTAAEIRASYELGPDPESATLAPQGL